MTYQRLSTNCITSGWTALVGGATVGAGMKSAVDIVTYGSQGFFSIDFSSMNCTLKATFSNMFV